MEHISKLQIIVNSLSHLQLDDHEYAYLKAIVLFSPEKDSHTLNSSTDNLSHPKARQVEKFQERAYQEMHTYIDQTFTKNSDRFPKLLLRLPVLRSIQATIVEELFFSGLIGSVQINSIIPYILKMDPSEFTPGADSEL
ncbi:nuclear receptor subfamily 2 group C member 1-like isoform X3 [Limulus polyphemus]|uniref:Nuclear receptor subfamily 2 group C member 1-like isoform X3 n=1 Tax=Limulus polyphemus TaxID=6850 RepID=A0ABM1RXA9_LIMPO|nr:nuclear receptor subfamily 2 group C member 1-like isoform X3 [Limulus polyphemus]